MRTIPILVAVLVTACGSEPAPTFGQDGDGGSASSADVGVGGAGGGDEAEASTSSSSSGGEGGTGGSDVAGPSSSSSASSSSSGVVEPGPECEGAARGTPCTEGGGHLCDGAGVCVEFIGVKCRVDGGKIYTCGDGFLRTAISTNDGNCQGGTNEWPYCHPGVECIVMSDPPRSGTCID